MYSVLGKISSSGAGLARRGGSLPALAGAVLLLVLSDWLVFPLCPALSTSSAPSVMSTSYILASFFVGAAPVDQGKSANANGSFLFFPRWIELTGNLGQIPPPPDFTGG